MLKLFSRMAVFLSVLLYLYSLQAVETQQVNRVPQVRARVIVDNDFGGDCDGLFALAHQLLSPSVEIRGIIGSHQYPDGFYGLPGSSENACALANELLKVMDFYGTIPVYQGADERLGETDAPVSSEAAQFIVQEAMRVDVKTPLYVACGAGLTDLASAYLIEPQIAKRIRLIWIGGPEYKEIAYSPPGASTPEYNLGIDLKAGQVVFNQSEIPIWQVPRDAYRQALVSHTELRHRMKEDGKLAGFLSGRLSDLMERADYSLGEGYVLGDNPLVLLTALQSAWESDPSSSEYKKMPAPWITGSGLYQQNPKGRPIRVYTRLDIRLMFEDFYAKITAFDNHAETKKQNSTHK